MGLFDFMKKDKDVAKSVSTPNVTPATTSSPINLSKEERVSRINLNKETVHGICLNKPSLNNLLSRVGMVIDYSWSMETHFKKGVIQDAIEMAFPIALEFDDNGAMEMWIFDNGFHRLPDLTIDNFHGYVEREIMSKYRMGGTCYAPVMEDVIKRYTKEEPANIPNYILYITDGDNSDKDKTTRVITEASKYPVFWQFVGIGRDNFSFLQKLDDMLGRYVDNADFFRVNHPKDITYDKLLNEYPDWLANQKVKDMLNR